MFTDIVGYTEISSRIDPEELREVIRAYQSCVARAVNEFGGYVARYIGDGILIYFGWPRAGEMDPESAVRAGLAAIQAVSDNRIGVERLHVRVAIATGLVVLGDAIDLDTARQTIAFGETPNRAARLQTLAEPDSIVIDDATRRQVGGLFDCQDLDFVALKGFPNPVRAWRVLSELVVKSRFDALHNGEITPLIGREAELAILLRLWRKARAGEGQLVLVSGEPGIGKSRLIAALEDHLATEAYTCARHVCFPDHQDSALYPISAWFANAAGFDKEDTPADKLEKIRRIMPWTSTGDLSKDQRAFGSSNGTISEDVALIADLLSIPLNISSETTQYSPRRKKERTFDTLMRRTMYLCEQQPLLMFFEDIHWADPSSLELLDRTIQILRQLPILLILSFRPEMRVPWIDNPVTTLITLRRLTTREAELLATGVGTGNTLPSRILRQIVARSDGVPLFIEELTKTVLEHSQSATDGTTDLTVPATLRASLMARLDRLPTAKQVAQIGSAIGREFSLSLIRRVAPMPDQRLAQGLEQLVAAGFLFHRETPPGTIYVFKHVLVQEAAYDSLLRSRRAEIHAAIVREFERNPGVEGPQPALLGYHCAQAGFIEKAATYYRLAGERSAARAALAETLHVLERGLALARALPDTRDSQQLRAELLVTLGRILHMTRDPNDPEALAAFKQAIDLSRSLAHAEPLTRALLTRFLNLWRRGTYDAAQRDAQELLDVGVGRNDPKAHVLGHLTLGYIHSVRGQFTEACADIGTARRLLDQNPDARIDATFGTGVLTNGLIFEALGLACMGHLDRAASEAAAITLQIGHILPFARASALLLLSRFALVTGDANNFLTHTHELMAISEEQGFHDFVNAAKCSSGLLTVRAGRPETGITEIQNGIEAMQQANYRAFGPYWRLILVQAFVLAGQIDSALRVTEEALALSSGTGEVWLDSELYRQRGSLLLQMAPWNPGLAEKSLRQAIQTARRQSARLFELRAATTLARVWSVQGRRADARGILEPACAWFSQFVENSDYKEAQSLLLEL